MLVLTSVILIGTGCGSAEVAERPAAGDAPTPTDAVATVKTSGSATGSSRATAPATTEPCWSGFDAPGVSVVVNTDVAEFGGEGATALGDSATGATCVGIAVGLPEPDSRQPESSQPVPATPALTAPRDSSDDVFVEAADMFERARTIDNFAGFFYDSATEQHVLAVKGDTAAAENLVESFPGVPTRVEQATYSFAELEQVSDAIVAMGDRGWVDTSRIVEPFASLVEEERLSVGIEQSSNRVVVYLDISVPNEIRDQIAEIIDGYGFIRRTYRSPESESLVEG